MAELVTTLQEDCPLLEVLWWRLQCTACMAQWVLPALQLAGAQAASPLVRLCVQVTEVLGQMQGCEGTVTRCWHVSQQQS